MPLWNGLKQPRSRSGRSHPTRHFNTHAGLGQTHLRARHCWAKKGNLAVGEDADITIFDPAAEWEVQPEQFFSKSRNTPFAGWKLTGKVVTTIVGGRVVYHNGSIMANPAE